MILKTSCIPFVEISKICTLTIGLSVKSRPIDISLFV